MKNKKLTIILIAAAGGIILIGGTAYGVHRASEASGQMASLNNQIEQSIIDTSSLDSSDSSSEVEETDSNTGKVQSDGSAITSDNKSQVPETVDQAVNGTTTATDKAKDTTTEHKNDPSTEKDTQATSNSNTTRQSEPTTSSTAGQPATSSSSTPENTTERSASTTTESRVATTTEAKTSSSTSSSTASSTSATTEHQHNWQPVYESVYHAEVGHYENVEIAPEYSYTKYEWHTFCSGCDFDYTANGVQAGQCPTPGCSKPGWHQSKIPVGTVTEPALYEERWVVDTPAGYEDVLTGYKCSVCGATKSQ